MNGPRIVAAVVATLAAVGAVFAAAGTAVRVLETHAAVALLSAFGADVEVRAGVSIQVFPTVHDPFRAVVTPSCSALSAVLALAAIAVMLPGGRRPRLAAFGVAAAVVLLGNLARIAGSIGVGLLSGRSSLVLFHDWVGATFAFCYVIGGFLLMLRLLARSSARGPLRLAPAVAP